MDTQRDGKKKGITPAYAGNTCSLAMLPFPDRDHPRLRGEHCLNTAVSPFCGGSPPPTRGTQAIIYNLYSSVGITPAYAGNTRRCSGAICTRGDHPRLRGEHSDKFKKNFPRLGSPPPTRGTPYTWIEHVSNTGITPAYAGNTYILLKRIFGDGDHPRLRGEHEMITVCGEGDIGSPPPTRGTPIEPPIAAPAIGITPAYAGNTKARVYPINSL